MHYSPKQPQEPINSSVCEYSVQSVYMHTYIRICLCLCTQSASMHILTRVVLLCHSTSYSLEKGSLLSLELCWKSFSPGTSLVSALLGAGTTGACLATLAFHLSDEIQTQISTLCSQCSYLLSIYLLLKFCEEALLSCTFNDGKEEAVLSWSRLTHVK